MVQKSEKHLPIESDESSKILKLSGRQSGWPTGNKPDWLLQAQRIESPLRPCHSQLGPRMPLIDINANPDASSQTCVLRPETRHLEQLILANRQLFNQLLCSHIFTSSTWPSRR